MLAAQLPSHLASLSVCSVPSTAQCQSFHSRPAPFFDRSHSQQSLLGASYGAHLVPSIQQHRAENKRSRRGSRQRSGGALNAQASAKVPGRPAEVTENKEVGRGTKLLSFKPTDGERVEYEPGHVLSFYILDDKGKWARHPYTVTSCDAKDGTISFVYRIISDGKVTPLLSSISPGTEVRFEGYYHVPILRGLAEGYEAVVGLATGSGIGPLYGFAHQALAEGTSKPFVFIAGYRQQEDIALAAELDALAKQYSNFSWVATLSEPHEGWGGLVGRVGQALPTVLKRNGLKVAQGVHFHLVGNGAMVHEMTEALKKAGVADANVTIETYFNHKAKPDEAAVKEVAEALAVV